MPSLRLNALISLLVAVMVVLSLGLALWLFNVQLRDTLEQAQASRVTNLAQLLADRPHVREALRADRQAPPPTPDSALQAEIDTLRQRLGVDFIVIMNAQAVRLTHPDPARIGRRFRGDDEGAALAGASYASRSVGTLGTSIRGFAPVSNNSGQVIGAVAVGVTLDSLGMLLAENRQGVIVGVVLLMVVGALAARWLAHYIKRVLLGLEPYQITRLVEERQAMLASVHEGILAVDHEARITLANPAAHALLAQAGLGPPPLGCDVSAYLPQSGLPHVLASGHETLDQELQINGQAWLVNHVPIRHQGVVIGAIATLRDKDEVSVLAEQLTGVRRYAEALRASTHEFKNKLHVLLGLAQMGDLTALRSYLGELAEHHVAPTTALVAGIGEPVLAGFLLGKQSEARERDITLDIDAESVIPAPRDPALVHVLVTVLGNLLENAFEAVAECATRRVMLTLSLDEALLCLHVQDTGVGIPDGLRSRIFEPGVSSKGERRGLGLAMIRAQLDARGGALSLYSEPGRGTLVEATLPYSPQR